MTALVTPFLPDGQVDENALGRLVDKQIRGGADALVVLGTTGEAVTLTEEEKRLVVQLIVERNNHRLPLILGMGGNNTAAVLNSLHEWETTLTGHFAAILSVCPYYNKPSQEGLYQHFRLVAEASPVPVILYNVPGRTGVNLLPETVVRLANDCPQIAGIKEASGNIEQIRRLIQQCQPFLTDGRFVVISGDDGITAQLMDMGADGLISVAANAFPEDFGSIVREHNHRLQDKYAPMVEMLFKEGNPAGIKTVLAQQGLIHNRLRLPLVACSPALQQQIEKELEILTRAYVRSF